MDASLGWSARTRHQEANLPLRGAACVIEPADADRGDVSALLRRMGFSTHETGAGALGAQIAEEIRLSVIVVNVMVQDVQGLKLLRHLREKAPSAVIIALTPDAWALTLAKVAGADAVLASPPQGEVLAATITEALDLHHTSAATAPGLKKERAHRAAQSPI